MELFRTASMAMKLDALKAARYAMRHGGASDDLLACRRSLAEDVRRGRWRTDVSLRRYDKEIRILDEVNKLPLGVLQFGARVSKHIVPLLLGQIGLAVIAPVPA